MFSFSRRPVKLVYSELYSEIIYAIKREKQIKGWSRKKKQALINGKFEALPKLSKSYTKHPSTSSGRQEY